MESISAYSAEILRLLGQDARFRIVEALRGKELYVTEIFATIKEQQSNTSRHLSLMVKNGILGNRKVAPSPKCYYRINLDGVLVIIDLAKRLVAREREGLNGEAARPYVVDVLKEIGQSTRMAIIDALRDGELAVAEIIQAIGKERSNTSRHLSGMVAARLLSRRGDGLQAYYRLKHSSILEIVDLTRKVVEKDVRLRQEALLRKPPFQTG